MEHHGVQPISCMDNEPQPSRDVQCYGLPRKTDKFRLHPTQCCAPEWRCDRVSSLSSSHTLEVFRHLPTYQQLTLALSHMPTTASSIPDPTRKTIAMTNYTHTPLLFTPPPSKRSSNASWGHPYVHVFTQQQQQLHSRKSRQGH